MSAELVLYKEGAIRSGFKNNAYREILSDTMLLDLKDCSGQLYWQENAMDVIFDLSCTDDGSIKIILKSIPLRGHVPWIYELIHKRGRCFEVFRLKGCDINNNFIASDSVIFNSPDSSDGPTGKCSQLTFDSYKQPVIGEDAEITLQYHLLGFHCFDCLSGKSDLGLIELAGSTHIDNYDEVTGLLTIKHSPSETFNLIDWVESCDKLVRSVLDIMSLANGRYIAWTIRTAFYNEEWSSSRLSGPRLSGRPSEPLFSHLNLQSTLSLALSTYTEEFKHKTGLDVAIEWLLMDSTYTEAVFLAGMTALEHLVYIYAKQKGRLEIFKKAFGNNIQSPVCAALDESLKNMLSEKDSNADEISGKILSAKDKIIELNRYSFKENMQAMLKDYEVPLDGIEQEIYELVGVRNKIVHRGLYVPERENQSVNDHLAVLRELLKRIFLTLLKYRGQYQSFLNGPDWIDFPPSQR